MGAAWWHARLSLFWDHHGIGLGSSSGATTTEWYMYLCFEEYIKCSSRWQM
jgi:hypothetical protein